MVNIDMKIHHVGYLVKKLEKAKAAFEKLGYVSKGQVTYDEIREIDILFMKKDGYVIELVSPKTKESVVANLIKKLGNTPYHICYEVDDIEGACEELSNSGYMQIDTPTKAVAIGSRRVVFLMNPFMGMIELVEKEPK